MKLLLVSNLYPPNAVGGYEVLCYDIATGLSRRGHDVSVLTSSFGGRLASFPGQTVHQMLRLLAGTSIYDPFNGTERRREVLNGDNARALRRMVGELQPDVIFCWNLYALGEAFLEALIKCPPPISAMLTDNWLIEILNPNFLSEHFRCHVFGTGAPVASSSNRISHHRIKHLGISAIFGSEYMRDLHSAAGITFDHHSVVHNGVRQSVGPFAQPRDRTRIGQDGEIQLLCAGRIVEIKGVHTAIEALSDLQATAPAGRRYRLTILGDGQDATYIARLRETAMRLGCIDQVVFRPAIAATDLWQLFQEFDIYLFPSLYEPFSLTLIHALAAGIPTVASRVGGNVEIIQDGETGVLFTRSNAEDLACAVSRVTADAVLRTRISRVGRLRAQSFTLERMLEHIEAHLASEAFR